MMEVFVPVTSCSRPELLQRTLRAFLSHVVESNPRLRFRILVNEDGARAPPDPGIPRTGRNHELRMQGSANRRGQMASLDDLYSKVGGAPWVLQLEDDWEFPASLDLGKVLAAAPADASCIVLAEWVERGVLGPHGPYRLGARSGPVTRVEPQDPLSFGYSLNPSLVPTRVLPLFGTFAAAARQYPDLPFEAAVGKILRDAGLHAYYCAQGGAVHIGGGEHVFDPRQPHHFQGRLRWVPRPLLTLVYHLPPPVLRRLEALYRRLGRGPRGRRS